MKTAFTTNTFWRTRVGDIHAADDLQRIRRESLLVRAGSISKPILVTHGTLDERVPISQSDALVRVLEEHGRPVTYLVFPDEGHDFAHVETWEAFWAAGEAFLRDNLRGIAEPFPGNWNPGRVEIRVGASRVETWRTAPTPGRGQG